MGIKEPVHLCVHQPDAEVGPPPPGKRQRLGARSPEDRSGMDANPRHARASGEDIARNVERARQVISKWHGHLARAMYTEHGQDARATIKRFSTMDTDNGVIESVRRALGRSDPLTAAPVPPAINEPLVRLVHSDIGLPELFADRAKANKMAVYVL